MQSELDSGELDQSIKAAFRREPAVWTPSCPDIETWMDLADQGSEHSEIENLRRHLTHCAYCRREYATQVKDLRMAARIQEMLQKRNRLLAPSGVSSNAASQPSEFIQLHWQNVAAAATEQDTEAGTSRNLRGIFCEGALLVTVFFHTHRAVLIAENHQDVLWEWDEALQPSKVLGAGISLRGLLFRYSCTTPEEEISGFFVLPQTGDPVFARITLGDAQRFRSGQLRCELAAADELKDSGQIINSIQSSNIGVRRAWVEYARQYEESLPDPMLESIVQAAEEED